VLQISALGDDLGIKNLADYKSFETPISIDRAAFRFCADSWQNL
jgi:hypothetical protein